jgi:hypothetical protein
MSTELYSRSQQEMSTGQKEFQPEITRGKRKQKKGSNECDLPAKYPIPSTAFSQPSMPDKHPTDVSSFFPPKSR